MYIHTRDGHNTIGHACVLSAQRLCGGYRCPRPRVASALQVGLVDIQGQRDRCGVLRLSWCIIMLSPSRSHFSSSGDDATRNPPAAQALYPFTWERAFDAGPTNVWMEDNGWFPVAACVLYAAVIVGGQRAMRSRQAFQLRGPLASWNLLLAIFSAVGTIRLVPHALTQLNLEGFHHLVSGEMPPDAPSRKSQFQV